MTNTRNKLEEAKYFLLRMVEVVTNRTYFKHNLSAFLSAARSVTLIMQNEFDKIDGFKEWYIRKQNQMSTDPGMHLMNKKRVMTIHQKPVKPRGQIDVSVKEIITITEHVVAVLTHKDGTVERIEPKQSSHPLPSQSETEIRYRWFFEEIPNKDIITLSREYTLKLESIVRECESKFHCN